eukprot:g11762.t1
MRRLSPAAKPKPKAKAKPNALRKDKDKKKNATPKGKAKVGKKPGPAVDENRRPAKEGSAKKEDDPEKLRKYLRYDKFNTTQLLEKLQSVVADQEKDAEPLEICGLAPGAKIRESLTDFEGVLHSSWKGEEKDQDADGMKKQSEEQFGTPALQPVDATKKKGSKVAYLVMGEYMTVFQQVDVWMQFFKGCPEGSANLYAHAYKQGFDIDDKEPHETPGAGASDTTSRKQQLIQAMVGQTDPKNIEKAETWRNILKERKGEAKFVPTVLRLRV